MDSKSRETPKKCFCARCFFPIEDNEKVEIDGQNFHKMCSTCCMCHCIPNKLKMFYGHVFCEHCFNTFVITRIRGNQQAHMDSWWMRFAPGVKPQDSNSKPAPATKEDTCASSPSPEGKRCVCARCLQTVETADKVEVCGQTFHANCARCCSCHQVPKDTIKIYYGHVFCEECFQRHILSRQRDNPAEFFQNCFEQWKNNPQFADGMKLFMEGSSSVHHSPLVFVAPTVGARDESESGWVPSAESKSAKPTLESSARSNLDSRPLLAQREPRISKMAAVEKIAKLTRYLSGTTMETPKKWKISKDALKTQNENVESNLSCPKCWWQSGNIFVDRI